MSRDEPRHVTVIIDKPHAADVQWLPIGRLQDSIHDVSVTKNRSFLPGNLIVYHMLPQSYIEFFTPLRFWFSEANIERVGIAVVLPVQGSIFLVK